MSWLTFRNMPVSSAVALCGLYDGPLETYLTDYPHVRQIVLCLDADGPGEGAAERLREKYGQQGYGVSYEPPPQGKDWNAYLQLIKAHKAQNGAGGQYCLITRACLHIWIKMR